MKRSAEAHWAGNLREGNGRLATQSGALSAPYAYGMRFADEPGTNPEELIAAAHAGCFSMAFSGQLAGAGFTAESIDVKTTITFEKVGEGWTLLSSHLEVTAKVPGATREQVAEKAEVAKKGCPVSRALNMKVSMALTVDE